MPTVTLPKIPEHFPIEPEHFPKKPGWTWVKPVWIHPEIPVEIPFPLVPAKDPLRLEIEIEGRGTFVVTLALTAAKAGTAST